MAARVVDAVNKPGHACQCQAIKNLQSALFVGDHPRLPQHGKMPRDRAPAEPAGFHQLADALLAAPAQLPHNLHTRRVRQSSKDFVGRGSRFHSTNQIFPFFAK